MWLLKYLFSTLLAVITFFHRLLRDWWRGVWQKLRPTVVALVGWGAVIALVLIMITIAPELTEAILNLVFAVAVLVALIYFTLYALPGGGKKRKK